MARDMYLVGVSEEELKPDPKPEGPKTPKGKWENYWYHYKWHTLGGLFAVVVLTVLIVQLFTRNEPDYTLTIVTENPLSQSVLQLLQAEMEVVGRDLDEDGYVEVRVDNLYMGGDTQLSMANAQKLTVYIGTGDTLFFAFEPQYYEMYIAGKETGGYHFFDQLDVPDEGLLMDGRVWNWKDGFRPKVMDAFADATEEFRKSVPQDLYFGVRKATGTAGGNKNEKKQAQTLELLRAFIAGKPLEDAAAPAK